jgi:alkylation response protein AidB-like acyl-CoA dehydrogenase
MDFSLTSQQQELADKLEQFAREELNPHFDTELERAGTFPRALWAKCGQAGIQGLNISREYGGQGHDVLTSVAALEAFGYGCTDIGLPFALLSQMWSAQAAIAQFGSEEQKQRYLPGLCSGEQIGAFGITERDSGSDTYAMAATATRVDGGYRLTGTKCYITLAPVCDIAIVFANSNPAAGKWGITGFIVERGMPGFSTSAVRDKMGLRTTPMGDLILDDCFVPESSRLGPEGAGVSLFTNAMESERGYILAAQLGSMRRQLDDTVRYARERQAFGQPIGKFQSVSNRVAEMKLRLETARLLLFKVAWLDLHDKPLLMEAALANLHLSECFVASSIDAIHINGARGYVTEFGVERDLRDGVGGLIYSGTSDIQRQIVARLLGL